MAHYIDSDKLRSKIEKLQERYLVWQDMFKVEDTNLSIFFEGKAKMCGEVFYFLHELEKEQENEHN